MHQDMAMADHNTALIDPYLKELWERNGTDLLLTADTPPRIRVDGALVPIPGVAPLREEDTDAIILTMLGEELAEKFHRDKEVDFSFSWGELARIRANAFHQKEALALSLRVIP